MKVDDDRWFFFFFVFFISFEQKPRKYRLVPYSERHPPRQQKDVEFMFETEVESVLPKNLQETVKMTVSRFHGN